MLPMFLHGIGVNHNVIQVNYKLPDLIPKEVIHHCLEMCRCIGSMYAQSYRFFVRWAFCSLLGTHDDQATMMKKIFPFFS